MTDVSSLWSDEINAFVDAAFDSGIVSRNPSDAEEHIAYRYAIKLAIDESSQAHTDALKAKNERLREHLISALDTLKDAEICNDECGLCNEARAALEQSQ
jgi:hypothetical protein